MTSFIEDMKKGKIGEEIFQKYFLDFLNIKFTDVRGCQQFQIIDSDYLTKIGTYEIKTNYKDNKILCIEEFTDIKTNSLGWFYKSKADMLVFISKKTSVMLFVPFTTNFKTHYENIKDKYDLIKNAKSYHNGNYWQSAFRKIPLDAITGYYSFYYHKESSNEKNT